MVNQNQATAVRCSKEARFILGRYASLKGWSKSELLDQIAYSLRGGINMLDDTSVPIETLKKFYNRSIGL